MLIMAGDYKRLPVAGERLLPPCYHSEPNQPDAAEQRRGGFLQKPALAVRLYMVDSAVRCFNYNWF
jgi:hypothetical protein